LPQRLHTWGALTEVHMELGNHATAKLYLAMAVHCDPISPDHRVLQLFTRAGWTRQHLGSLPAERGAMGWRNFDHLQSHGTTVGQSRAALPFLWQLSRSEPCDTLCAKALATFIVCGGRIFSSGWTEETNQGVRALASLVHAAVERARVVLPQLSQDPGNEHFFALLDKHAAPLHPLPNSRDVEYLLHTLPPEDAVPSGGVELFQAWAWGLLARPSSPSDVREVGKLLRRAIIKLGESGDGGSASLVRVARSLLLRVDPASVNEWNATALADTPFASALIEARESKAAQSAQRERCSSANNIAMDNTCTATSEATNADRV